MTTTSPHQAIYRRWRAQTFGEIVGQEAVVETLRNAVRQDRVAHAVLFVGPRGTGKTSLARILAKALNCTDLQDGDACDRCPACTSIREGTTLDLVEIDAASNRGIDAVRELRERLPYPPGELRRKVYILDEAHQITKDAWNALLKSLEEPPDFVSFMFASTEPSGFPAAILSRLQRYDVRRLTVPEIEGKLRRILAADGRTADDDAIALIARLAAGGMRDAESMLDQLMSSAPDTIDEQRVRDLLGLADAEAVDAFVTALVDGDAAAGIALLDALEERGRDARVLLDQAIDTFRGRLVQGLANGRPDELGALADAARRLAAIDPERAGIGGLRLQLELALFSGPAVVGSSPVGVMAPATTPRTANATARTDTPDPAASTTARGSADQPTRPGPSSPTADRPAPAAAAEPSSAAASPAEAPAPTSPTSPATPATAVAPAPAPIKPTHASRSAVDTDGAAAATGAPTPSISSVTSTPADGELSLDGLIQAWPRVVELLSRQPAVKQLITTCRPVALDGAIVTLGFPEEQGFLRDVAERKRGPIEAGIHEITGRDVGVRCVVANIEIAPLAGASDLVAEARRIFGDELADVGEVH